jgi:hypothetical protein
MKYYKTLLRSALAATSTLVLLRLEISTVLDPLERIDAVLLLKRLDLKKLLINMGLLYTLEAEIRSVSNSPFSLFSTLNF